MSVYVDSLSNIDVNFFDIILCDSDEEIENLKKHGLKDLKKIYTISPYLISKYNNKITRLDKFWKEEEIEKFQCSINPFTEKIYRISRYDFSLSHQMSIGIGLELNLFHRTLFYILSLSNQELNKKILHIKLNEKNELSKIINLNWEKYFKNFDNFYFFRSSKNYQVFKKNYTYLPNLYTRLSFAGFKVLISRLIILLNKYIKIPFRRKQLFILKLNNSILDLIPKFYFSGFNIKFININEKIKKNDRYVKGTIDAYSKYFLSEKFIKIINKTLNERIINFRPDINSDLLFSINEEVQNLIQLRVDTIQSYYDVIKKNNQFLHSSKNFIFTNSPINNPGLALSIISDEKKIKMFSFQHGITEEIVQNCNEGTILNEINASDVFVSYNKQNYTYHKKLNSIYNKGSVLVAGMPDRNTSILRKKYKITNPKKIIFISSNLYKGYFGQFSNFLSDFDRYIVEKNIVTNVLAKVNSDVSYKHYPETNYRFVDEDPIKKDISKLPTIQFIDNKIDLRYLLKSYNIFITCKATSTISWPLLTNKPTILINYLNNSPLNNEVYNLFDKGIFVYNYYEKNFEKNILSLLNLPIKEINKLWLDKQKHRNILINKIFSSNLKGSGDLVYKYLEENFLN